MAENELDLKHNVGDTLQLQLSAGKAEDRFYVRLIGFLKDKSILVTSPRADGAPLRIDADQKFIVRMISGNSAQGFSANAICSTKHPYPHLHLTYPTELESITVRKAERIDCKLIVSVQNEEAEKEFPESKSASMENLSTVGSQLTTSENLGDTGDTISISCKVTVADMEMYLNIKGIIRRITEKDNKVEHGIEFITPDDKDKLLLYGFIYEQLLNISS